MKIFINTLQIQTQLIHIYSARAPPISTTTIATVNPEDCAKVRYVRCFTQLNIRIHKFATLRVDEDVLRTGECKIIYCNAGP